MPRKPLTPEQRERKRLMDRLWRERNKERIREYQRAYDLARKARSRPGRYKPVPKDETPEERRARRAEQQERIGQDPEALVRYRARRAAQQRVYWSRLSPEERARRDREFRERRDADPERYEAFREAKREWARRRGQVRKQVRMQALAPVGEVFRTQLYSNELYRAVMAELSRFKPGDYRDDLAAEAILFMLEGEADPKAAVRQARRSLGGHDFKTVSLDAPNQRGETLHDYLASEERAL